MKKQKTKSNVPFKVDDVAFLNRSIPSYIGSGWGCTSLSGPGRVEIVELVLINRGYCEYTLNHPLCNLGCDSAQTQQMFQLSYTSVSMRLCATGNPKQRFNH